MEYKKLGKSDLMISPLVLGCWELGGDYWGEFNHQVAYDYIHKAFEMGINSFDTAEQYGIDSYSEVVLGKMIADLPREKINVMSKIWLHHMPKNEVEPAVDAILKRMNIEYLDTLYLHYPNWDVPFSETMEALNRIKAAGKIRSIGVSNFNPTQLGEIMQYGQIDVVQPCFNLVWRFADKDGLLQMCMDNDVSVVSYAPLGQGLLTGAYLRNSAPSQNRRITPLWQPEWYPKVMDVTDEVKKMAEKYGKTAAEIALNFVVNTPGITAPIVGVANNEQVVTNLSVLEWKLEKEDYDYLDKVSKDFAYQLPRFFSMFDKRTDEEFWAAEREFAKKQK